ncbi:hypothetical protein HK405_005440 [Cladochytrium tenue]|nr:hypothetical protein HK405_005440 [Cladochytrium tenue]
MGQTSLSSSSSSSVPQPTDLRLSVAGAVAASAYASAGHSRRCRHRHHSLASVATVGLFFLLLLLAIAASVVPAAAQSSSSSSSSSASSASSSASASVSANSTATTTVSTSSSSTSSSATATSSSCYDCSTQGCLNYGTCTGSGCSCPAGFGGTDCSTPLCGSANSANSDRPTRSGDTCTCDSGFSGPNCNICESDDVCTSSGSVQSPVCNKNVKVWKSGYMSCTVNSALLKGVYPLTSVITFYRNVTAGQTLGALWYNNTEQFMCDISDCSQQLVDGQYQWYCSSLACECIGKSAFCGGPGTLINLASAISEASGSLTFTCDSTNSTSCNANFAFLSTLFPSGLTLDSCDFGECALPSDNPDLQTVSTATVLTTGEKAGVVIAAAVFAVFIAGLVVAILEQNRRRKAPEPPERPGVTIGFSIQSYKIGNKSVLRDVTGAASVGKVFSIMGPSGEFSSTRDEGETTLLDLLAGKTKSGVTAGAVTVGGEVATSDQLRELVGYVDQEDLLLSTMTVRETLLFSAELRLPESTTAAQRASRVDAVLADLGLTHVAGSRIGGFGGKRGISGGERRRVSIGVELVTNPPVLLLDEPTSGLDSYNALSVMRTLTDLARKKGKTIVFTIHQPRSDVYALFDDLLVLSAGQPLFCGAGADAARFCRDSGRPCPDGYNIADHLLDIAAGALPELVMGEKDDDDVGGRTTRRRLWGWRATTGAPASVAATTANGGSTTTVIEAAEAEAVAAEVGDGEKEAAVEAAPVLVAGRAAHAQYRASFLTQLGVLLKRSARHLVRSPTLLIGHLSVTAVLAVFVGAVYFASSSTLGGIQNRFGAILFMLSLVGFASLSAVGSFAAERALFLRERSNGFYGASAFYCARLLADVVPLRLLPALLLGCVAYPMVGLAPGADHFGKFIGLLLVFSAETGLFCMLFAVAVADVGAATLCGAIVMLFNMLFSGWLVNQDSIFPWLGWIQYLSLFRYTYEAMVVNDLSDLQVSDSINGVSFNVPASVVLAKFGFDGNAYWRDFLVSVGFLVFLGAANFVLVHVLLKEHR